MTKNPNTKNLNLVQFSSDEIGDNHMFTSIETPIKKDSFFECIKKNKIENLSIIPANADLSGLETEVAEEVFSEDIEKGKVISFFNIP